MKLFRRAHQSQAARATGGSNSRPRPPLNLDWLFNPDSQLYSHNSEGQRLAQLMSMLLRVLIATVALIYLSMFNANDALMVFAAASALLLIGLLSAYLVYTGRLRAAILLLIGGTTLVLTLTAWLGAGVVNIPYIGLVIVIIVAGLLLGGGGALVMAGIASLIGLGLVIADLNGFLPKPLIPVSVAGFWVSQSVIFFSVASLIYLSNNSLQKALLQARQKETEQKQAAAELEQIRSSLQDQIAEHTHELEQRTGYLQAILEVSQSTAALLDREQVMRTAVQLIKDQFRLYYVGLFLVDLTGDWAVLQAGDGPGQAVQAMLSRGHRIRVGSGMIGWSIANAQPRIAGDAGQDIVRLATVELPETRSEAAIPLRSRGRVIGAISVQSQRSHAFGEMEIAAYLALADQIAITLDNARLYRESTQALENASRAYGQTSQRAWQDFLQGRQRIDMIYRYGALAQAGEPGAAPDQAGATPSAQRLAARQQALSTAKPVQISDEQSATLYLPIPVREIQIGVISFTKEKLASPTDSLPAAPGKPVAWLEDEIELLQTVVEQMGMALDSARLYQDTQRLAQRELVTSEVTAHIRQTLDIQTVLHTAVEEIQRVLGLPEVIISLSASEEDQPGGSQPQIEAHEPSTAGHDDRQNLPTAPAAPAEPAAPTAVGFERHNGGRLEGSR